MVITVDTGAIMQIAANAVVITGGVYGFWRYVRRKLNEKPPH